jgi:hypothetical protein
VIIGVAALPIAAQTQDATGEPDCAVRAKTSNNQSQRQLISFGVLNGKAKALVEPVYPRAAMAVNAHGNVTVQIIVDARGCVETAMAISGHPLLRPASVNAALKSTFYPVTLSGNPIRVSGVIHYKYWPNRLNWLELGYSSDSKVVLQEFLPDRFNNERELIESLGTSPPGGRAKLMQEILKRIDTQLIGEPKNRWLFNMGRELKLFKNECRTNDACAAPKLRLADLLNPAPTDVSPLFIIRLKELIGETDISGITKKQFEITERLFDFGN